MRLDPPADARRFPWHDRPGVDAGGGRLRYGKVETVVLPFDDLDLAGRRADDTEARVVAEVVRLAWAEGMWPDRAPEVTRRLLRFTAKGSTYGFEEVTAPGLATHVEVAVDAVGAPRAPA